MGILSEIYDSEAIGTCLRPLRRVSVLPATESSLTVSKYSSQKKAASKGARFGVHFTHPGEMDELQSSADRRPPAAFISRNSPCLHVYIFVTPPVLAHLANAPYLAASCRPLPRRFVSPSGPKKDS
jgi:hypothetical protein